MINLRKINLLRDKLLELYNAEKIKGSLPYIFKIIILKT